jgi:hypothetical protein
MNEQKDKCNDNNTNNNNNGGSTVEIAIILQTEIQSRLSRAAQHQSKLRSQINTDT